MIPVHLRLRNFMCYRGDVAPLDFAGIHLACLTGPNGHGKSALLDAMTWALWGKARAKRDDDLIHLGESEMEVEFVFDLGGTLYRVLRKRDSSRRGQTVLDLQVQHGDAFRSISGDGVRGTQEAIIRLLRMDYDTFTNSAFLLQGRADAFTTRTPAERKRVLGEILGLSRYDEYEQRAKEQAKDREQQVATLDGTLRDIDRELARQAEYEAEVEQAQTRVTGLGLAIADAEGRLLALRREEQVLALQQGQLQGLERRLSQAKQELAEVQSQIAGCQERLAGYERLLADRGRVEQGYAMLLAAREAEMVWNERLGQYARLRERQRELERAVDDARHAVELERGRLIERVQELQRRAETLPRLMGDLEAVRQRLTQLEGSLREREAAQARLQALAEDLAGLRVENEQLKADMEALRDKVDLLRRDTGEARCPLCGQGLSDEHRDEVVEEFERQGTAWADRYRANVALGRQIEAERARLARELQELDRRLEALPNQQRREAQLEQAAADARQASDALTVAQADLVGVERQLQLAAYAAEEQVALAELSAESARLAYDPEAHEAARGQVAALVEAEGEYQRLQVASERLAGERAALEDLHNRLSRLEGTVLEDSIQRDRLAAALERLPELTAEVQEESRRLEELQVQASRAREVLGGAQQKVQHCRYLAEERLRRVSERQQVAEEKAVFDELRLAFGKKGIQAMIIEAAIPEIEVEANRLLRRMTHGRMNVRFDTQRETLKGDTVETLDINIADELGTRPYELFSGGEAFRVNFAIRIALSKLLARRAGAQLQLLVIDEGFGTQDAEGRERLVEAINTIQEDFARILVITHIEELRDAFPVRIEVTKTASGSQFSLN
jgi:DNA repair protein SbcC/Rad50